MSSLRIQKRLFDIALSFYGILFILPLFILIAILVKIGSDGPILFLQKRVVINGTDFLVFKFRTMYTGSDKKGLLTVGNDDKRITGIGNILRKTKLDEFPQLWNVLKGDMSLVGPRPCLYSQKELINERLLYGVFDVKPGITGISQIEGVDMSNPKLLTRLDSKMIISSSIKTYFY